MAITDPGFDDANQLPSEYQPYSVRVCFDGVEAFRVVNGETIPGPSYQHRDQNPNLLEMYWDDEIVYVIANQVVTLHRLRHVAAHAIQMYFDLSNF